MRYASIDIETTGLNPETCQILEFGCVLDNTDPDEMVEVKNLPTFRALILHKEIHGEPYALAMNHKLIAEIRDAKGDFVLDKDGKNWACKLQEDLLADTFFDWLTENGYEADEERNAKLRSGLICAGKNFASFDKQFLLRTPDWDWQIPMKHRVIDPAMWYMHPDDKEPPKTELCYERANISDIVAHTAVEDAMKVCLLVRHAMKFYGAK
jgi:hypothetical protein